MRHGLLTALLFWALLGSAEAATIVTPQAISLVPVTTESFVSAPVALNPLTDAVTIRLQRPTTISPTLWTNTGTVSVAIVITCDGIQHRAVGQASGGIRTRLGVEVSQYSLTYHPTTGFFGATSGSPRRLGQTCVTFTGHIELTRSAGSIPTTVTATTTESPAPIVSFHSSVAFDAATDAQEVSGDGVLSLSHTASGSNLAAFSGSANASGGTVRASTSTTYNAVAMTEIWDVVGQANVTRAAGYTLANPATGAQTVTNTLAGNTDDHALNVISMTGVNQTVPAGTPATNGNAGGVTSRSVTVGSVGLDDLVVDWFWVVGNVDPAPVAGADQTERTNELISAVDRAVSSTQLGTAGGVMSWTFVNNDFGSVLGAVAFKPVATGLVGGLMLRGVGQ